MSTAAPAFLATCWTSAGDVMPLRGGDTSPVDIRERVETVARTGYTGFGLTRQDLVVARSTIGLATLAAVLADNGIETVQLEWLTNWWTTGDARRVSDAVRADLFHACPVLGVDNIKAGADDDGVPVSYDQLCQGFGELADDAAEVGVRLGFENTPFSHHVRTTDQAITFVTDVGHPNGGLILDIWHAFRGGTDYAEIPRRLPLEYVVGVELDDGVPEVVGTHPEDTFDNRLLCGDGAFGVPSFIRAVRATGWSGPWGIEHMSTRSRTLPIRTVLAEARQAAVDCFATADRLDAIGAADAPGT